MRRTVTNYIDLMKHALGKTPDARHDLGHTFNDAGRALVNAHPWSWRTRSSVPVTLIAGQQYATLPEDFGEIVDVSATYSQTITVQQTSLADLNRRRSFGQYDAMILFVAFEDGYDGPTDTDGTQQNRMQVYPTPAADRSDILITYRAKWIDQDQTNGNRVPNIPRDWERSLILFARSFAVDIENQVDPYENQALYGPTGEVQRLIVADAGRQTNHGRPLHNVLSAGRGGYYPHRRITR